ncbi:hypothetical protein [Nitrosomonas sp. Is79A3]|jgi:hypothetical protein
MFQIPGGSGHQQADAITDDAFQQASEMGSLGSGWSNRSVR